MSARCDEETVKNIQSMIYCLLYISFSFNKISNKWNFGEKFEFKKRKFLLNFENVSALISFFFIYVQREKKLEVKVS